MEKLFRKLYCFVVLSLSILVFSCPNAANTVKRIVISSNKEAKSFCLADNNGTLILNAEGFNSSGEKTDSQIQWDSNLPENVNITTGYDFFSFIINDIEELGDYTISAKAGDVKSVYSFSINTDEELGDNLVYSYVSGFDFNSDG